MNEYILKQNTTYLMRFVCASTTAVSYNLYWYED
jgi:hypothetical protein